jgi:hypothetical protein
MKLLEQGRLAAAASVIGVLLIAGGRAPQSVGISLALTAAGGVCLLAALAGLWGLAGGFQNMLEDLQAKQTKA